MAWALTLVSSWEARRITLEAAGKGGGAEACALRAKLGEAVSETEAERAELSEYVAEQMQRSGGNLYKWAHRKAAEPGLTPTWGGGADSGDRARPPDPTHLPNATSCWRRRRFSRRARQA